MTSQTEKWALAIHGGAGQIDRGGLPLAAEHGARAALEAALAAGTAILAAGGAALDAVEAAVRVLEDDPHFNAGRGAVLTHDGRIELDAAIMDGRTRAAGAVCGVTATRNPVQLARAVMVRTPHVFLARDGADAFARAEGLPAAGPDWFETPERRRQLAELKARGADAFDAEMKYGTVGAVARDASGHVAAATSTGGVTGKKWGRVGDSPLIGAGTYADDRSGAVSATGSGEFFIRSVAAHEIAARVRLAGDAPDGAAAAVIAEIGALGGTGGVIFVGRDGPAGWVFNSRGMYRGRAMAGGDVVTAIYGDEP